MNLETVFENSEQGYINRFCEEYKDKIKTPDCFTIVCKDLKKTAYHICYGKVNRFQGSRAQRILWPKYILMHPEKRDILINQKNNNFIFFYSEKRKHYIAVCKKLKKEIFNLITGYPVSGQILKDLKAVKYPYSYYKKEGC